MEENAEEYAEENESEDNSLTLCEEGPGDDRRDVPALSGLTERVGSGVGA
jgi:hypothetical protein